MTQRPIDHIVHCVGDLDAARAFHRRLGFTLTPEARHSFGTGNSLVQLQGNFLELVKVADPSAVRAAAPGHFSFGAYNAAYLEKRRGVSMLVFQSSDARRDQSEFVAAGLDTYAPFDFERKAKLPDGSEVTVGFSLVFVTHPEMPDAVFFTCQQHAPQHFWKPEYQRHANSAFVIDAALMIAKAPHEFASFFTKLQGEENVRREGSSLVVETRRGRIELLDPATAKARFPDLTDAPHPAHFIGHRIRVRDLAAAAAALRGGDVRHEAKDGVLRIAAADNFGAALEFVA